MWSALLRFWIFWILLSFNSFCLLSWEIWEATGLLFPQLLRDFQVNPAQVGLASRHVLDVFRVWMFWRYIVPPGHCDIKGNGTSITTHVGPSEAQAATSFTLGNACGLVLGGGARMGRRQMVLTGLVVAIGSSLLLLVASRRWMSRRSTMAKKC